MKNTPRKRPFAPVRVAQKAADMKVASDARPPQPRWLGEIERKLPASNFEVPADTPKRIPASQVPQRLIPKREILEITGTRFPTIWSWMRRGQFPRSRIVGGRSMWVSTDIEAWMHSLPLRKLKGDEAA